MAVTAGKIKELREISGAGMLDCKNVLKETDGDLDKALDLLREKGLAAAAKKAGRAATEGLVQAKVIDGKGVIVEVNSETDFVAKNQAFVTYVEEVLDHVAKSNATTVEDFSAEKWDSEVTVAEALSQKIAVIGENLSIRRFERLEKKEDTCFVTYIHGGGKVAVLLEMTAKEENDKVVEAGKNVCMQIAAMGPKFVSSKDVDQEFVEKEKEILTQQALNEGKPANIVENMVKGRLNKQLKEYCLLEQEYVKAEAKETVLGYLEAVSKEVGFDVNVTSFVRFETGEGLEKKEENFAEEVAKTMQG